jgi:hypothetical protein
VSVTEKTMEKKAKRNCLRVLRVIGVFLFLLSSYPLFSQETGMKAEVGAEKVARGYRFTYSLTLSRTLPEVVEEVKTDFPKAIRIVDGPTIRSVLEEDKEGEMKRAARVSFTLMGEKMGWWRLPGPFVLFRNGDIVPAPDKAVGIGRFRGGGIDVPISARWDLKKEEVYVGETLPVLLRAEDLRNIGLIDSFNYSPPSSGSFEKVSGIGEIEQWETEEVQVYSLPAAAFLFTPFAPGEVTLPPGRVSVNGQSAESPPATIIVKPLPQAVMESGAVGSFSFSASVDMEEMAARETLVCTLRLSGEGNMAYLSLPTPLLEGLTEKRTEEYEDLTPGMGGYRGVREIRYYCTGTKRSDGSNEEGRITVPDFTYLDPVTGEIERIEGGQFSITLSSSDYSEAGETKDVEKPLLLISPDNSGWIGTNYYRKGLYYLFLLPGAIILVVLLILGKLKLLPLAAAGILAVFLLTACSHPKETEDFSRPYKEFQKENYNLSALLFEEEAKKKGHYFLYHNAGVSSHFAGERALAVYFLRKAVYKNPLQTRSREALTAIENEYGLEGQTPLPFPVHPELFFFSLIFFVNFFFALAGLFLFKRNGVVVILLLLMVAGILGSTAGLIGSAASREKRVGIVMDGREGLKKIPMDSAEEWFSIEEGTAVQVMQFYSNYILVETGYGIKGWIGKMNLAMVSERKNEENVYGK